MHRQFTECDRVSESLCCQAARSILQADRSLRLVTIYVHQLTSFKYNVTREKGTIYFRIHFKISTITVRTLKDNQTAYTYLLGRNAQNIYAPQIQIDLL